MPLAHAPEIVEAARESSSERGADGVLLALLLKGGDLGPERRAGELAAEFDLRRDAVAIRYRDRCPYRADGRRVVADHLHPAARVEGAEVVTEAEARAGPRTVPDPEHPGGVGVRRAVGRLRALADGDSPELAAVLDVGVTETDRAARPVLELDGDRVAVFQLGFAVHPEPGAAPGVVGDLSLSAAVGVGDEEGSG